jgi:ketosteroid isomerase-like protein
VQGDWAFARSYLQVAMTPPGQDTVRRAGWVLSILRKGNDGRWRIARDANLMAKVT